jgi:thioester reductase-like protein
VVPEAVPDDFDAPEEIGYAESKFVWEHLVQNFSRSSGIPSAILRTGRIADRWKGMVYGIEMNGFQALWRVRSTLALSLRHWGPLKL